MFFAGQRRFLDKDAQLGMHQFSINQDYLTFLRKAQEETQQAVSTIISSLSQFDIPDALLTKIFKTKEMYWLRDREIKLANRGMIDIERIEMILSALRGEKIPDMDGIITQ